MATYDLGVFGAPLDTGTVTLTLTYSAGRAQSITCINTSASTAYLELVRPDNGQTVGHVFQPHTSTTFNIPNGVNIPVVVDANGDPVPNQFPNVNARVPA